MSSEQLTARERQGLRMTAAGLLRREIANKLYYGEVTIKRDRIAIIRKLGARNMYNAVLIGAKKGLIDAQGTE